MPFTAGDLCCVTNACVLLDTAAGSASETWDAIPHVTQIQWTEQANTPKVVTSSTAGKETSVCGTVTGTGTLSIACHDGNAPAPFRINGKYHLRWSLFCEDGDNIMGEYYEANVRIVTVPNDYNISGGGAVITSYGWEIIDWIYQPDPQAEEN